MGKELEARSAVLERYKALVETNPRIELKGVSMPYTSFNGHMFSFIAENNSLALRLPDGVRETFLHKYATTLCVQHETLLKEYVVVPDSLLKKKKDIEKYFRISFEYVESLRPKVSKKKTTQKTPYPKNIKRTSGKKTS